MYMFWSCNSSFSGGETSKEVLQIPEVDTEVPPWVCSMSNVANATCLRKLSTLHLSGSTRLERPHHALMSYLYIIIILATTCTPLIEL